jgi:hypothetical protein
MAMTKDSKKKPWGKGNLEVNKIKSQTCSGTGRIWRTGLLPWQGLRRRTLRGDQSEAVNWQNPEFCEIRSGTPVDSWQGWQGQWLEGQHQWLAWGASGHSLLVARRPKNAPPRRARSIRMPDDAPRIGEIHGPHLSVPNTTRRLLSHGHLSCPCQMSRDASDMRLGAKLGRPCLQDDQQRDCGTNP